MICIFFKRIFYFIVVELNLKSFLSVWISLFLWNTIVLRSLRFNDAFRQSPNRQIGKKSCFVSYSENMHYWVKELNLINVSSLDFPNLWANVFVSLSVADKESLFSWISSHLHLVGFITQNWSLCFLPVSHLKRVCSIGFSLESVSQFCKRSIPLVNTHSVTSPTIRQIFPKFLYNHNLWIFISSY